MTLRQARKIERLGGSINARTNARAARRLFQWDGWRWPIRVKPKNASDSMMARRMSKHLCWAAEQQSAELAMSMVEADMARSWYSSKTDVLSFGALTADELMGKEPDGNR